MRSYVSVSLKLAAGMSVVIALVTSIFCADILRIMRTPENIFEGAYAYLLVTFIGVPFTFFYNLLSSIIRALGDSKTPFWFLLFAAVLNIILDLFCILVLGWGVAGAAIATVFSQGLSAVLCYIYMYRKFEILQGTPKERRFQSKLAKTLLYIVKRLLLAVLTVWVVITVTFFATRAVPGGPFASEKAITPAAKAALEAKYGLDKPVLEQYTTYLKDIVLHFDFGPSLKQRGRQVIDVITDGLKTSAKLGVIAAFASLICGVVLGAIAALRRNKVIDRVIMVITTAFVSMPSFIMGSLMLVAFSIKLAILPANGSTTEGLILPVITLALYPTAYITRLTRSSMLDVLGQDYIRTAKAKGVPGKRIIFGHALKNSLIPVITYFGPMLAYIVTGSLVVEQIFAVPGIGRAFVNSIINRDYPLIMGTTIVLAALIVIMNLVGDILYKVVDPRINLE